jgi:bacitracin transport system permease protein
MEAGLMYDILYTEFLKLKRSKVTIMILIGGITPALMTFLAFSDKSQNFINTWGWFFNTTLMLMCYIAPALFSLITGIIIIDEYQNNTLNLLFTCPVQRIKFLLCKYLIIVPVITLTYALSIIFTLIFGLLLNHNVLTNSLVISDIKINMWMVVLNIALLPLASAVSLYGKSIIGVSALGICYICTMFFLSGYKYNTFFPWFAPAIIASSLSREMGGFIAAEGNCIYAYISLVITFFVFIILSAFYFIKADVHYI